MSLYISSLNSGSNANAYYVGTKEYGVLIDAGLSLRNTKNRLQALGLSLSHIRAIFISHEHDDHIRGLAEIANLTKAPVFASSETFRAHRCFERIPEEQRSVFVCGDKVIIGELTVECFAKKHDGIDPHSFVITDSQVRIGVITDIGHACEKVEEQFRSCNAVLLEANYDEQLLADGPYPFFLKRRISGHLGHLSNQQALQLYLKCRTASLSHLILGHLSKNNNDPMKVEQLFAPYRHVTNIFVASRYEHSPMIEVRKTFVAAPKPVIKAEQLSLF